MIQHDENIWETWPAEKKSDLIHNYVMRYSDRNKRKIDYGTGEFYTSVEMHILEKICAHPGITVTELSKLNFRTKGAISQIVKKLDQKKLINRVYQDSNAKQCGLYPTETGSQLNELHLDYDRRNTELFFGTVAQYYDSDQLDSFFKIMETCFLMLSPDEDYPWT